MSPSHLEVIMSVKIIKFINGDEIIGDCKQDSPEFITVSDVAQIMMVPTQVQGQAGMALAPFIPYSKSKSFDFNIKTIMTMAEPVEELYNQYNKIFGSGIVIPTMKV